MLTKGMIMVVTGVGGIVITFLLGIIQFNSSKKKVKALQVDYEKISETSNIIVKNLDSYNSVQDQDARKEDSTEMLGKDSTELLNEDDDSTEILQNARENNSRN